ncbi:MAG: hypothetical protein OEL57_02200 [Trichlorobacter sp.]|uniref:hypothetical protein n=1 Tax=Trichlorobacter sp. TaxID=2911007 RepID=UPI002566C255|nr:hypothetical protein [Trichlorobacter sp.]MDK9716702.1 hypothetical protein [Trichlorobacter sp.]
MLNFKEIENRIKKRTGLTEGKDIAALFKLTPQNYSNKKGLGTILPTIIEWAIQENVNLDWLLKGEQPGIVAEDGPKYIKGPVVKRIDKMLEDMDEEAQRDVLKYTKEKKLLVELMAEKQRKAG